MDIKLNYLSKIIQFVQKKKLYICSGTYSMLTKKFSATECKKKTFDNYGNTQQAIGGIFKLSARDLLFCRYDADII